MAQPINLPAPTQDEKTMALLAEIFQIFTWWIGPLIFYLIKRESKFVAFHAMQALLWQCTMMVLWMVCGMAWIIIMIFSLLPHMNHAPAGNAPPPVMFFAFFGVFWLGILVLWALNLLIGIFYGVKASRGEWAEYPLLGRLARRIVEV
jgi:uncharacterized protein